MPMQSYLFISSRVQFFDQEIQKLQEQLSVLPINKHVFSPPNPLSIATVRIIGTICSRKPYIYGNRLIVIYNIESSSIEAANALLKMLEEPPNFTYFVLTASNQNRLLSTIVSRCQVLVDKQKIQKSEKGNTTTVDIIRNVLSSTIGARILLSQKVASTKEDTLQFLDSTLLLLEQLLNQNQNPLGLPRVEIAKLIHKFINARKYIEGNVNHRQTLDVLFMGFPTKENPKSYVQT